MPRLSIILPVYNGASTVARALESVFAQSFTDYEVIVVDDGSTDGTQSVLAGYGDRIRVIRQSNRGVSASRNAGMRAAAGEYIAFLDDDDEWMPEMIARCAAVLDQDRNCVLAYTGVLRVDLTGTPMANQESQIDSPTLAQMLERPWTAVPSQFMVRRATAERVGGFDERLGGPEDIYFLLLARELGSFGFVPELLVRKTTRPLYPKALNREQHFELLTQMVRQRYGARASGFIRESQRKRMKVMKHMARVLIEQGRLKDARRCLARLIHYQPTSPKAYRRYLKTFLPTRMMHPTSSTDDSEA